MIETFTITYKFTLADNSEEVFELVFDAQTVELIGRHCHFTNAPPAA